MQHPEEGTIHAWIDGELDAAAAASLEAHVASCAACAALVAEARGLAAASSRILGALDEVPSGVIPDAMPPIAPRPDVAVTTPSPTIDLAAHREARTTRRTRRVINPRYAAAAAVMVMAIGTWTVFQRASVRSELTVAAPAAATDRMESAALGPASAKAQDQPAMAPTAPPAEVAASRGMAAGKGDVRPSAKATTAPTEAKKEREVLADASASRDKVGNAAGARQALAEAAPARVDTVRAAAPVPASDLGRLAQAREDSARFASSPPPAPAAMQARARLADSVVANEARRLTGELRLQGVVTTGAASATRRPEPSDVACYVVDRSPLAAQHNIPERIALYPDTVSTAGAVTWRAVRVPGGAPIPWWWLMQPNRVIELARIAGTPPVITDRVVISTTGGATPLRASRVDCALR